MNLELHEVSSNNKKAMDGQLAFGAILESQEGQSSQKSQKKQRPFMGRFYFIPDFRCSARWLSGKPARLRQRNTRQTKEPCHPSSTS